MELTGGHPHPQFFAQKNIAFCSYWFQIQYTSGEHFVQLRRCCRTDSIKYQTTKSPNTTINIQPMGTVDTNGAVPEARSGQGAISETVEWGA